MIITTEMARALLLVVLAQHEERYDSDCGVHGGCSCGWGPENLNANADNWGSRRLWQEHLASVILYMKEEGKRS